MTHNEFKTAFEEHRDAVYRFAWRMMSSPAAAEDVVQDVFLALLRLPGRFDPGRGKMRSFLIGITRNLVLKRWRDENKWEELVDEQFMAESISIERSETARIVGEAVRALPLLQREVLILAEYEELSLEEIARAVEAEVGTVKSRLHRARENLRRMLAPLKSRDEVESENMEPLDDNELNQLLRQWAAPPAPPTLANKLFPREKSWWKWLFTGTVRVPIPVALAAALLLVLWIHHSRAVEPPRAAEPATVSLAGFKPVRQLQPVVVVGGHK